MRKYTKEELNGMAKGTAKFVEAHLMDKHRGCIPVGGRRYVIFGNDSYATDKRSQEEAADVLAAAVYEECPVSDIQTTEDGQTWAIAFVGKKEQARLLHTMAWVSWFKQSYGTKMPPEAVSQIIHASLGC